MLSYRGLFMIGLLILTLDGCSNKGRPPFRDMALQPLGPCDTTELTFIRHELINFFHRPVVLLPEIPIPHAFLNLSKGERYSADSLIRWLAGKTNDSITQVIGFTHKDIFTTDKDKSGKTKEPKEKYEIWGIFGLGFCPGKASVVSDYRLQTTDQKKFDHRLRTVILHEVGHNIGLPHCPNPHCIMNDANEKIATVDNSADDYCPPCRSKIDLPHYR
jgi:archaemetzincin